MLTLSVQPVAATPASLSIGLDVVVGRALVCIRTHRRDPTNVTNKQIVLRCWHDGTSWIATAVGYRGEVRVRSLTSITNETTPIQRYLVEVTGCSPEELDVRVEVAAPSDVVEAVAIAKSTRDLAADYQDDAAKAARAAVRLMTGQHGFSATDAGAMLGVSRQRVHQLLEADSSGPTVRSGSDGLDVVSRDDLS